MSYSNKIKYTNHTLIKFQSLVTNLTTDIVKIAAEPSINPV